MIRLCLIWAAVLPLAASELPLRLEDVLTSVERHYPPLLAALEEGAIADAEVLAAAGRFDTTFKARLDSDQLNLYPNSRVETLVEQALEFQGASLFAGYRLSGGEFASYDGRLDTRDRGEWRSGFRLPLMRDRAIDSRRASLRSAELGRVLARLSIDQQRMMIRQAAARRYWDWVASGQRARIAAALLGIAEKRDEFLRQQVEAGALPRFEVADNERIVLQRRSQVVEADRAFQQAAIELSLYIRDQNGRSRIPAIQEVPEQPPRPPALVVDLESEIEAAIQRRPEVGRLDAQRGQNQIDLDLARNQRKPAVDVVASFAQDLGVIRNPAAKVAGKEAKASLVFELPFQRRTATGNQLRSQARDRQIAARQAYLRDQVRAEVTDAWSALSAARERLELIGKELEATRRVEEAERARFELGEGTLFVLNLREQATADVMFREAGALADLHRAHAVYELATAAALK